MRKHLNLSALTGGHNPRDWPDPRRSWSSLGSFSLSRRRLMLGAAAAAVGLSPAGRAAVAALASFQFDYRGGAATFALQGKPCWVIDPRRFAGSPRLQVEQGETPSGERWLRLTLTGARFPGLALPADFTAEIRPALVGSTMALEMALGGFRTEVSLENWLAGTVSAAGEMRLDDEAASLSADSAVWLAGAATALLTPDWQLQLAGRDVARVLLRGEQYRADRATLALLADSAPSLLNTPVRRRSMLVLEKGAQEWPALPLTAGEAGGPDARLVLTGKSFDLLRVEAAESRTGQMTHAVAAESLDESGGACLRIADGPLITREGEPLELPLAQVRAALAFHPEGEELAVTGRFTPTTAMAGAFIFGLGDDPENPGFALQAQGGERTALQATPTLLQAHLPMAGGLVQSVRIPPGVRLDVASAPSRRPAAARSAAVLLSAGEPVPVSSLEVIRPRDLVNLRFEFSNLGVQVREDGSPALVRTDRDRPAHIVVHFPPQHIAEQTFNAVFGAAGRANARISEPSQVAFLVPDTVEAIDYTLDALLNWTNLDLALHEVGQLTAAARPEGLITRIEAPYRLWLAPAATVSSAFVNATTPVTNEQTGRTELWHTRLALRENGAVRDSSLDELRLQAIWSRDLDVAYKKFKVDDFRYYLNISDSTAEAFPGTTLQAGSRIQVVGLTSDPTLNLSDPLLRARRLMLSSLGAWLDVKGYWELPENSGYSLALWEHQMLMGRDQYVKTERLGYLCPFGHLCSLIQVTTREVSESGIAYLISRTFIIVHNQVMQYDDRDFPFKQVRILDDTTPLLSNDLTENISWIWPQVGTQREDFRFKVVATDWDDREITFSLPLLFVMKGVAEDDVAVSDVFDAYKGESARRTVELNGALVAYAPPEPWRGEAPHCTMFATDRIRLEAAVPRWNHGLRFRPAMASADIQLPRVDPQNRTVSCTVAYDDQYKKYGFTRYDEKGSPLNWGEVYLKLLTPVYTELPDEAGGIVNPDFEVVGIARRFGAVGDLEGAYQGQADPNKLWNRFSTTQGRGNGSRYVPSMLFGRIPLNEVFGRLSFNPKNENDLNWLPRLDFRFWREQKNINRSTKFVWKPTGLLKSVPAELPFFDANPGGSPTELLVEYDRGGLADWLEVGLRNYRLGPRVVDNSGWDYAFRAEFSEIYYRRFDGYKKVRIRMSDFTFGKNLFFFNALTRFTEDAVLDEHLEAFATMPNKPPSISIFQWRMPLHTIAMSLLNLQYVRVGIGFTFPLQKNAGGPEYRIQLSDIYDPFIIKIKTNDNKKGHKRSFVGAGYVGIGFTTEGVTMAEASLEVGWLDELNLKLVTFRGKAMLGLYFRLEYPNQKLDPTLPDYALEVGGFVRLEGQFKIPVIVNVRLILFLMLSYNFWNNTFYGTVHVVLKVRVLLFTVRISFTARYALSGDPDREGAALGTGRERPAAVTAAAKERYIKAYADAFGV
mgnify:CR=1 FL=1